MASQITSNTENKKVLWSVNLRPKVGQSVTYLGNEWVSLSGINIEPTLVNSNDWILSTNGSQEVLIFISQWNAETNTPELINGNKNKFREAYISLNDFTRYGIDWEKGDYLVYDINGDIFKEKNPLLNIVSTVGFSNDYDDLDNLPIIKRTNKTISESTYTLSLEDVYKFLEFSVECTVTVPLGLSANLEFEGLQSGTGQVTFTTQTQSFADNILNVFSGFLRETAGQHAIFGIRTKGSNEAVLIGTLKLA